VFILLKMLIRVSLSAKYNFKDMVTALAVTIDSGTLVSGSIDKSIKLWRIANKELICTFENAHACNIVPAFIM